MNLQQSIAHVCLGDPVTLTGRVPSRVALAKWAESATMKRSMAFIQQAIRELRSSTPPIVVVDNLRERFGLPARHIEDLFLLDMPPRRNESPLQVLVAKSRRAPNLPDLSQYKVVPFGPAFSIVDD